MNRRQIVRSAWLPPGPPRTSSVRPRFKIVFIMPGIETAAPLRTETSSGFLLSPKTSAKLLFQGLYFLLHGIHQRARKLLPCFVIGVAHLGRDRESWWDRQANPRHFSQVGTLAAQQLLLGPVAIRAGFPEVIRHLDLRGRATSLFCHVSVTFMRVSGSSSVIQRPRKPAWWPSLHPGIGFRPARYKEVTAYGCREMAGITRSFGRHASPREKARGLFSRQLSLSGRLNAKPGSFVILNRRSEVDASTTPLETFT
jgi:hypothetical protein